MKILSILLLLSLCACSSNDPSSQQVAWDNMSYVDSYEKLNSNLMTDLSSKIK